jgi:hypothetical protein
MRPSFWLLFVLIGLAAAAAAQAPESDELKRNRDLLVKWKLDDKHYERLQRDLAAFYAMSAEKQQRMRELDRQLHETDPATQARLWAVLERYVTWLERLPKEDRDRINEATGEKRLQLVSGIRRHQWEERLPRHIRRELAGLSANERDRRVRVLRSQEPRQRALWEQPLPRLWPAPGGATEPNPPNPNPKRRPQRTSEFPLDVQAFIKRHLLPHLRPTEERDLAQAQGKPGLPRLIARLAEKYPVLPPKPSGAITKWPELPGAIRKRLDAEKRKGPAGKIPWRLQSPYREWPEFALAITGLLESDRRWPALGASKPAEFPPKIRDFLRDRLFPALSPMERTELRRLEGRWPDYPRRLLYLARLKELPIPDMSLPGSTELWSGADTSRLEQPEHDPARGLALFAAAQDE